MCALTAVVWHIQEWKSALHKQTLSKMNGRWALFWGCRNCFSQSGIYFACMSSYWCFCTRLPSLCDTDSQESESLMLTFVSNWSGMQRYDIGQAPGANSSPLSSYLFYCCFQCKLLSCPDCLCDGCNQRHGVSKGRWEYSWHQDQILNNMDRKVQIDGLSLHVTVLNW